MTKILAIDKIVKFANLDKSNKIDNIPNITAVVKGIKTPNVISTMTNMKHAHENNAFADIININNTAHVDVMIIPTKIFYTTDIAKSNKIGHIAKLDHLTEIPIIVKTVMMAQASKIISFADINKPTYVKKVLKWRIVMTLMEFLIELRLITLLTLFTLIKLLTSMKF